MTRAQWLRRVGDARAAAATFVVLELCAIPLLLSWGTKWWFWADDWDFLAARTGGNLGDLFRPHYQHWTTLPILAYRLLWVIFGIRHYVPYQLLVIVLHLTAALLLRAVMRRAGARPWLATLTAAVFVFFGSGAENIVVAFQITFVGSLVFGLTQLLLADHDGPLDRRDWLGLVAGLAGLMCSGVGVTMTLIVGLAVLMRRGRRIALVHTVPLATAYLVWLAVSPEGQGASSYSTESPVQVVKFVVIGAGSAFGRLAQLPGLGFVLAAVLIVGLGIVIARNDLGVIRSRYAVPLALLAGALVFLIVTGLVRSGQPQIQARVGIGPERARLSRYVYLIAALTLPALTIAADAIARRWRALTIPIVILLAAGVPGNIDRLRTYANLSSIDRANARITILEAPRLPLAPRLPRSLAPAPFYGLSLGWLIDSLPSGRIPSPGRLSSTQIATITINLALRPNRVPTREACHSLERAERRVLRVFQRLTLPQGSAVITYFPPSGGASRPVPFVTGSGKTLIATTGPLDVEIAPVRGPTTLCG